MVSTPGVHLRLMHWTSRLAPATEVEIVADRSHRHFAGLGYCGGRFDRRREQVFVDASIRARKSALLDAHVMKQK